MTFSELLIHIHTATEIQTTRSGCYWIIANGNKIVFLFFDSGSVRYQFDKDIVRLDHKQVEVVEQSIAAWRITHI